MTAITESTPHGSGQSVEDFSSFCEGDVEPSLNKRINTLVDASNDYIVYLDDDLCVEWSMTDHYDQNAPAEFGEIANWAGHLETISAGILRPKQRERFGRLLGEGMARIIGDKDSKRARESLDNAESYLQARGIENARSWYIWGAGLVAAMALGAACALWTFRGGVMAVIGMHAFDVTEASLFGALGAFLSILLRSEKIPMDPAAGASIHYLESGARILMGIAGGFLIALAAQANILLGIHKSLDHPTAFLVAICTIAGSSEIVVKGLIKRGETSLWASGGKK